MNIAQLTADLEAVVPKWKSTAGMIQSIEDDVGQETVEKKGGARGFLARAASQSHSLYAKHTVKVLFQKLFIHMGTMSAPKSWLITLDNVNKTVTIKGNGNAINEPELGVLDIVFKYFMSILEWGKAQTAQRQLTAPTKWPTEVINLVFQQYLLSGWFEQAQKWASMGANPSLYPFGHHATTVQEVKKRQGMSSLHWACFVGSSEAVSFLKELGVWNLNQLSAKGHTPLFRVVKGMRHDTHNHKKRIVIMQMIISDPSFTMIDAQSNKGATVTHCLMVTTEGIKEEEKVAILKLFLQKNPNLNIKYHGLTVTETAARLGLEDVIPVIEDYEASKASSSNSKSANENENENEENDAGEAVEKLTLEEKVDLMMEAVVLMSRRLDCAGDLGVVIRKLKKQLKNN